MIGRRALAPMAALLLLLTACGVTGSRSSAGVSPTTVDAPATAPTADPDATAAATTATTTAPVDDDEATEPAAPDGTTTTTTPTSTVPELDVYDPVCVVRVETGDSLLLIADRFDDPTVTGPAILAENGLTEDTLYPDQLLDVCVDNGIDDVTGDAILERNLALVQVDVEAQQRKLNELFAGLGIRELVVDGISGPVTRQRLCAARLALGLPVSTDDMEPGGEEEQLLMAAESLPVPFTSSILSERWILIDRTCQIMFVGQGTGELVFVFPTSTGEPGHETRDQDLSRVFRFNPALDNGGWHNSTTYPVEDDNPLNGNMYKPLYFDRGQAIHGANNVPTTPQSKGCARLRVEHQDMLVWWLGLADSGPTTSSSRINVTVNVQGTWIPR